MYPHWKQFVHVLVRRILDFTAITTKSLNSLQVPTAEIPDFGMLTLSCKRHFADINLFLQFWSDIIHSACDYCHVYNNGSGYRLIVSMLDYCGWDLRHAIYWSSNGARCIVETMPGLSPVRLLHNRRLRRFYVYLVEFIIIAIWYRKFTQFIHFIDWAYTFWRHSQPYDRIQMGRLGRIFLEASYHFQQGWSTVPYF